MKENNKIKVKTLYIIIVTLSLLLVGCIGYILYLKLYDKDIPTGTNIESFSSEETIEQESTEITEQESTATIEKKPTKTDETPISGKKEIEIVQSNNYAVNVKWTFEIEDNSIVAFVKSYDDENQKHAYDDLPNYQRPNGGQWFNTYYVFKGLKDGKTTITFKKVDKSENTVYETKNYIIQVDKYNNIKLISQSN